MGKKLFNFVLIASLAAFVAACGGTKVRGVNSYNTVDQTSVATAKYSYADFTGVKVGTVALGDLKNGDTGEWVDGKDAVGQQVVTYTGATAYTNGVLAGSGRPTVTNVNVRVGVSVVKDKKNSIHIGGVWQGGSTNTLIGTVRVDVDN